MTENVSFDNEAPEEGVTKHRGVFPTLWICWAASTSLSSGAVLQPKSGAL